MPISLPDIVRITNAEQSGIVLATEVSGARCVATLEALYTIADPILSPSKNNTNNDALGQEWYVVAENTTYKLVDWNNRKSAAGWEARSSTPVTEPATWADITTINTSSIGRLGDSGYLQVMNGRDTIFQVNKSVSYFENRIDNSSVATLLSGKIIRNTGGSGSVISSGAALRWWNGTDVSSNIIISASSDGPFVQGAPLQIEDAVNDNEAVSLGQVNSLISGAVSRLETSLNQNISELSDKLDEHIENKNNPHNVFLTQLGIENLPLVRPVLSGTWTITPGGTTSTAATITYETGYSASWKGQCVWNSAEGYKNPERATGLITTVGTSGVAQSITIPSKSSSYTGTVTLYALKTGLTVSGSNVVVASGQEDSTKASVTFNVRGRRYWGYSENSSINESGIKGLANTALQASLGETITVKTTTSQYVYYCYPKSWGTIDEIIMNGATPVLSAFNRSEITIENAAGAQIPMYVYRSTIPGAYPESSTLKIS